MGLRQKLFGLDNQTTQSSKSFEVWQEEDGSIQAYQNGNPLVAGEVNTATGVISYLAGNASKNFPAIYGLSLAATDEAVIFDQADDGRFVFTQNDATYGVYFQQIAIASGTIGSLSKTAITASLGTALRNNTGTLIGSLLARDAWWISPTRIVFQGSGTGAYASKNFLWIANYNGSAWTVGNNSPAFDNTYAAVDLGLHGGGHEVEVKALHHRSLGKKDASTLLFGEYGISATNTSGTNDQIRVLRSTDGGATWSALLTWNTNAGTHEVRHVHAVIYDKHRDKWLICIGDEPYSCVIEWDGVSAAPPANTAPANFWQYEGWNVYKVNIYGRTGDISLHADSRYYLTDNSEVDTSEAPMVRLSTRHPLIGQKVGDYPRQNGRPALIQCEMPDGGALWASMSEPTDIGADGYRAFDFLYTPDGLTVFRVAKTRITGSPGAQAATLNNIAILKGSGAAQVYVSGITYKNSRLLPGGLAGTLVMNLVPWNGSVTEINATA